MADGTKTHHIFKWLRDSEGNRNANVNGSAEPAIFEYTAPEDHVDISRLIVTIVDEGKFQTAYYGNRISLTNGIKVEIVDNGNLLDLLDGETIKTNVGWASLCHDFTYFDIGIGNNMATMRWTFAKAKYPLILFKGQTFRVTIQDDLTGLVEHFFQIQGYQE